MIEPGIFGDPNYMELDQLQIPHPELGPLERRVEKTYEEALFEDDISVEDAQYWFTEPPGAYCYLQYSVLRRLQNTFF